jgi:hypothetical protein
MSRFNKIPPWKYWISHQKTRYGCSNKKGMHVALFYINISILQEAYGCVNFNPAIIFFRSFM